MATFIQHTYHITADIWQMKYVHTYCISYITHTRHEHTLYVHTLHYNNVSHVQVECVCVYKCEPMLKNNIIHETYKNHEMKARIRDQLIFTKCIQIISVVATTTANYRMWWHILVSHILTHTHNSVHASYSTLQCSGAPRLRLIRSMNTYWTSPAQAMFLPKPDGTAV